MVILYINACARAQSRTKRLADFLLSRLDGEVLEVKLFDISIPALSETSMEKRSAAALAGDMSDPFGALASQFSAADEIVIAAPYWDLSFPAVLKAYLEAVMTQKITFDYSRDGRPVGLCRAKKLYYVTSCGGPVIEPELGFSYVRALAENMFGIKETVCFRAEGLDIWGNDVEEILKKTEEEIMRHLSEKTEE